MYIKVRIMIGGGGIAPPEMAAPVGIHSLREEIQREIGENSNRDVSGMAKFSGSWFGI